MSISDDLSNILGAIAPESDDPNLRDGLLDLGAEDVHATGVTVADATHIPQPSYSYSEGEVAPGTYTEGEVPPGNSTPAGPFEHIGSYDLATDGGTLDVQAIGLEDELTIHEAKFVLGAENAPSSSTIDVRDEANAIAFGVDESFVSTLGSVHAENATIEQAGQFIETGYVNTISLNTTVEELQNLRVHDAEIVTNDKISPVVGSYSISDSLPNITVASKSYCRARCRIKSRMIW